MQRLLDAPAVPPKCEYVNDIAAALDWAIVTGGGSAQIRENRAAKEGHTSLNIKKTAKDTRSPCVRDGHQVILIKDVRAPTVSLFESFLDGIQQQALNKKICIVLGIDGNPFLERLVHARGFQLFCSCKKYKGDWLTNYMGSFKREDGQEHFDGCDNVSRDWTFCGTAANE